MDDLISSFNSSFSLRNEPEDNYQKLLYFKSLVENALESTTSDKELESLYRRLERFNLYTKKDVTYNTSAYTENPVLQNIIILADHYYDLCFIGTVRKRLVNCLNLYNHMNMCVFENNPRWD